MRSELAAMQMQANRIVDEVGCCRSHCLCWIFMLLFIMQSLDSTRRMVGLVDEVSKLYTLFCKHKLMDANYHSHKKSERRRSECWMSKEVSVCSFSMLVMTAPWYWSFLSEHMQLLPQDLAVGFEGGWNRHWHNESNPAEVIKPRPTFWPKFLWIQRCYHPVHVNHLLWCPVHTDFPFTTDKTQLLRAKTRKLVYSWTSDGPSQTTDYYVKWYIM